MGFLFDFVVYRAPRERDKENKRYHGYPERHHRKNYFGARARHDCRRRNDSQKTRHPHISEKRLAFSFAESPDKNKVQGKRRYDGYGHRIGKAPLFRFENILRRNEYDGQHQRLRKHLCAVRPFVKTVVLSVK